MDVNQKADKLKQMRPIEKCQFLDKVFRCEGRTLAKMIVISS